MKRSLKRISIALLIIIVAGAIAARAGSEDKPVGKTGPKADALAHAMLEALDYDSYQQTRFIEWSFREKHFYKWDKSTDKVEVKWNQNEVIADLNSPELSEIIRSKKVLDRHESQVLIKKAIDYFNNDSFWLVAPYKLFDPGVTRSIVEHKGQDALLVTYHNGGSTPGDSYLWILDKNVRPISYKMWVSIIPIGGIKASWKTWKQTESGAWFPTQHKLLFMTLDMGNVRGYH